MSRLFVVVVVTPGRPAPTTALHCDHGQI